MRAQQNIGTHIFQTPSGKIIALKENGVIKAKSIRYAYSERFQKPISVKPTTSEIIFPNKTPVCPQLISPLVEKMIGPTPIESFDVDESTQYLSVTVPENNINDPQLPVVVWIHGGSYEIGCGDMPTSEADNWVREQDIIFVSVSYRLGLFGFLGGNGKRPPNLGLFDCIEALRWIKTNISFLGGNPENVTLLGQSSGGDAIAHLMIAEGVEGLFKRVIIQSAPLGLRENRKKMTAEFLKKTENLKNGSDVLKMIDEYKKKRPSVFKYGLKAAMPFSVQYGYPPLCNEEEAVGMWKKQAKQYDVLIGLNHDETAFYLKTSDSLNKYLATAFGQKIINKLVRITTDTIYGNPAVSFAENYAAAGGNVYLFKIFSRLKNNILGAAHCIDLPLLFGNESAWKSAALLKDIPWAYIHENGKKLRKVWAEFARSGTISNQSELPEILELRKIEFH